jgi:hypothetical protein
MPEKLGSAEQLGRLEGEGVRRGMALLLQHICFWGIPLYFGS